MTDHERVSTKRLHHCRRQLLRLRYQRLRQSYQHQLLVWINRWNSRHRCLHQQATTTSQQSTMELKVFHLVCQQANPNAQNLR